MRTSPSSFGSRSLRNVAPSKETSASDLIACKSCLIGNVFQTVHRTPSNCGRDARSLYCSELVDPLVPLDIQTKLLVGNAIWSIPKKKSSAIGKVSFGTLSNIAASGAPPEVEYYGSNIFDLSGVVFICDVLSDLAQREVFNITGLTWLELHLFERRFFEAYFETKDSGVIKKHLLFYRRWSIVLGVVAVFSDPFYKSLSNRAKRRVVKILASDVLPIIGELPVVITI